MKIDLQKMRIAMADACMDSNDLMKAANMPYGTYGNIRKGFNVRPSTVGKVARALNVPVTAILAEEEDLQEQEQQQELTELLEKARLVSRYTWLCAKLMQLNRMNNLSPDQEGEMAAVQKELEKLDRIIAQDKG